MRFAATFRYRRDAPAEPRVRGLFGLRVVDAGAVLEWIRAPVGGGVRVACFDVCPDRRRFGMRGRAPKQRCRLRVSRIECERLVCVANHARRRFHGGAGSRALQRGVAPTFETRQLIRETLQFGAALLVLGEIPHVPARARQIVVCQRGAGGRHAVRDRNLAWGVGRGDACRRWWRLRNLRRRDRNLAGSDGRRACRRRCRFAACGGFVGVLEARLAAPRGDGAAFASAVARAGGAAGLAMGLAAGTELADTMGGERFRDDATGARASTAIEPPELRAATAPGPLFALPEFV